MTPTLTLLLMMIALAEPAMPAFVPASSVETSGPIARAVTQEAGRLAAAVDADAWSRVRQLKTDAEIIVTVRGLAPMTALFVRADDSELIVRLHEYGAATIHILSGGVLEVAEVHKRGPARAFATLGGIAAGLAISGAVILGNQHQHSCCSDGMGDFVGKVALGIALPIGGGLIGFHASGGPTTEVIYRR